MEWLTGFGRRLAALFLRSRFDRDMDEEMRLHLELRREEHLGRGLTPEEAQFASQRKFGNTLLLRESSADVWGWRTLEHLFQDLRYGARGLVRTPGFTFIAVTALALGIGANTAIFSVVNSVLLRPLAYQDPERLVTLLHDGRGPVAPANYMDWRNESQSYEAMGAADYWSPNLTNSGSSGERAEQLKGLKLTQSLLPLLGVNPLMGRFFTAGEEHKGADHEVILSYRLWQRRFNGDPAILGKQITLDGEAYAVIGVTPSEFKFAPFWATHAELWRPNVLDDRLQDRDSRSMRVFARLKSGVTVAQARAEMATLSGRLERQYPGTNFRVQVTPLKENVVGKVETPLLVLLSAVGFVLLIACANVAHMLLARTADRQKEIAVRTAMGASRTRMLCQFLTENLLLSLIGAVAGLLLAIGALKALVILAAAYIPRVESARIDSHVMLFLLTVTAVTSLLFGLVPAMHATITNLAGALKEGGRGDSDGMQRNRLRSFLVASEFALAFMLLIGAGLMIRSFIALRSDDPGFNPRRVLTMTVSVAGTREEEATKRSVFYHELLERVRTLPGVEAAGGINHLPLAGDLWGRGLTIEGRPKAPPGDGPRCVYRVAMPGYFETMRLPILRGRTILDSDDARTPGVVVINERAATEYWKGENPISQRVLIGDDTSNLTWLTIIGVVKNAKQGDWADEPFPEVYLAAPQSKDFMGLGQPKVSYITIVARTSGNPADFAPALKNAIWSFDENLPLSEVVTMDRVVADANAEPRFEMLLLGVFAAVALLLAAIGIYGVMSYSVSRRTREIGIRIVLGASRRDVVRMVIGQGLMQAFAGAAVGLAGALLLSQFMTKMLYGVRPTDPITFCAVAIVLGLVSLLAIFVPARRATRVEPMTALRTE